VLPQVIVSVFSIGEAAHLGNPQIPVLCHGKPWARPMEINYSLQIRQSDQTQLQGGANSLPAIGRIKLSENIVKVRINRRCA